jgi:hypothetical protein
MLVDRAKAGIERRRRGDDAEPDIKIQRGIPTMLYFANGSELKLKTIFEDEWVIVPRCAIPLVALEDSTMR